MLFCWSEMLFIFTNLENAQIELFFLSDETFLSYVWFFFQSKMLLQLLIDRISKNTSERSTFLYFQMKKTSVPAFLYFQMKKTSVLAFFYFQMKQIAFILSVFVAGCLSCEEVLYGLTGRSDCAILYKNNDCRWGQGNLLYYFI